MVRVATGKAKGKEDGQTMCRDHEISGDDVCCEVANSKMAQKQTMESFGAGAGNINLRGMIQLNQVRSMIS
jgi:hypothetical protein